LSPDDGDLQYSGRAAKAGTMRLHPLLLVAVVAAFGISGCDTDDGPAEETGRAVDETGENIREAAEDTRNAVEDACEDAKEGVDAEDTDC
jgi:predicted small secreted protein